MDEWIDKIKGFKSCEINIHIIFIIPMFKFKFFSVSHPSEKSK